MRVRVRAAGRAATACIAVACLCAPPPASAATPAGTRIDNIATLTFARPDGARQVSSNTVTLVVDDLLDVAIAADHPDVSVPATADTVLAVGFVATNGGNGAGRFILAATTDRDAVVTGLAIDSDGDGAYDPERDIAPAEPAIALAAGERRRVFVLIRGAAQAGTAVSLAITAAAAHGAPGTIVAGAGQGGGDAVVGPTGATATARALFVDGATAVARLDKSQTVRATDGSARARAGAIVTYRLDARFTGSAPGAAVADPIPAGTTYVPGSITLDGLALTDSVDADPASFDGTTVRVAFGDVGAATVRTVQFQTRIQ